jgi:cytoskeletal protein CcmA (bactofilin family)
MSHLTELQFSMLADDAIDSDVEDAAELMLHITECDQCRARLNVYQDDSRLIRSVFAIDAVNEIPVAPKFKKPLGFREFAFVNLMTGVLFWVAQFSWKTIFGEVVVDGFSWLTSLVVPDVYDVVVSTVLYLTFEGTAMFETYSEFIVIGLAAITIFWIAAFARKSMVMSFSVLLSVLVLSAPQEVHAFQHQKGDLVIGPEETINDTLLFTGDSLTVDGDINGDLVAFGKRIVINGKIDGNLIVAAQSITVAGEVTGTIMNAAESIDLAGLLVGGDFWAAGQSVRMNQDSRVDGNAILAGELVSVAGYVGRDLVTAAETAELSGEVNEDVMAYVEKIQLLGNASVKGDMTIHAMSEESLQQSSGATVGGVVNFEHHDYEGKPRNRYATIEFYFRQLVRLVAAFIVGYGLFSLFPRMQRVSLEGGAAGLATGGVGLVGLVSMPVIAVILAVTVIGLPIAFLGVFMWITAFYLAKILVAWIIGSMLLDDSEEDRGILATLAVGLIIVIVAINLPFVGGVISFIFTALGFGMLLQWLRRSYQNGAAV